MPTSTTDVAHPYRGEAFLQPTQADGRSQTQPAACKTQRTNKRFLPTLLINPRPSSIDETPPQKLTIPPPPNRATIILRLIPRLCSAAAHGNNSASHEHPPPVSSVRLRRNLIRPALSLPSRIAFVYAPPQSASKKAIPNAKFLRITDFHLYQGAPGVRTKFITPTPVQAASIPQALEGKDILATAQTGTGKTLAFLVPVMDKLLQDPDQAKASLPSSSYPPASSPCR